MEILEQRPHRYYDRLAVIAVDVQNDFCPGGSLAVTEGDLVVPAINRVITTIRHFEDSPTVANTRMGINFDFQVIATRDWHPVDTSHFAEKPDYKTTWPIHCVANTHGAAFRKELDLSEAIVVSKGTKKNEDAYSGFDGKTDDGRTLDEVLKGPGDYYFINDKLREKGWLYTALFVGGLATDYCVKATVLDARKQGYDTFVIEDGIRGVAAETTALAIEEMRAAGAVYMSSTEIAAIYEGSVS